MTESTQPAPDPSITQPTQADVQTPPEAPAKKAPAKKAAAKKAAAPAPAPEKKAEPRSLYLPALPEGFEYTGITATGKNGETISISPAGGLNEAGSATVTFEGQGLNREQNYADMKSAIAAGAKAAKAMSKIAEREAELAKVREEAFDL